MTGYIKNCFLLPRGEEQLFNDDGYPTLYGYAIIPWEVFEAMGGSEHPACKLAATKKDPALYPVKDIERG
jgi:hypothetical protein